MALPPPKKTFYSYDTFLSGRTTTNNRSFYQGAQRHPWTFLRNKLLIEIRKIRKWGRVNK